MANVNYISSAGTGKTYTLITEVLEKIKNETNTTIKDMLILTFTEKTAAELKEKLINRIKESLYSESIKPNQKRKLHKQLMFIETAYIGTFHSIFLRFLKKYPEKTFIDSSCKILSNNIDIFLDTVFEKWIEQDFDNDRKYWEEIIKIFGAKFLKVKYIFITLYKNRLKLKYEETDKDKLINQIGNLKQNLQSHIESLIKEFGDELNHIDGKFFHFSPLKLKQALEDNNIELILKPEYKRILKRPRNLSTEEKQFYENHIKRLENNKKYKYIEENIIKTAQNLKKELLNYNSILVLNKFTQFLKYVENIKKQENIIDFDDILEKMLNLLKENTHVREQIKKQFKYIFIDEFQDTDIIQNEIIKLISKENIHIFADPKQCIYTWRNANLEGYFGFIKENKFQKKVLTTNYRSTKTLVEFFNKVISQENFLEHIDKDYKEHLKPKKTEEDAPTYIKLAYTKEKSDIKHEAQLTVDIINYLIQNEGHKYKDIMILFRKNKHLLEFKQVFLENNIPTVSTSNSNLFEQPEVKLIINILKLIEYPKDQLMLLNVLKSSFIYEDDINIYKNKNKLQLDKYPNKYIKLINTLSKQKQCLTVEQIIDYIYQKTDILETFSLINGKQKVENLRKLKILAKQKTQENITLKEFIHLSQTTFEPEAELTDENAVNLMTMHKAKGLESKVVIIPLLSKEPARIILNEINIIDGKPILYFPKQKLISKELSHYEETLKSQIKQENERLFYVAITRAKEKLIMIAEKNDKKSETFYSKIKDLNIEQLEIKDKSTSKVENVNRIKEQQKELIDKLNKIKHLERKREEIFIQSKSSKRFTSVSQIMQEHHKEENTNISFSQTQNKNIAIYTGILVHDILENIEFNKFSKEDIEQIIKEKQNKIPEQIREEVIYNTKKLMETFKESDLHMELKEAKIIFRELPFTIYKDDTYIEGRIDLVYEKDNKIVVMDYKTNRYEIETEKQKLLKLYEKQKEYYLEVVKKLFPDKDVVFKLGLLWKGEIMVYNR